LLHGKIWRLCDSAFHQHLLGDKLALKAGVLLAHARMPRQVNLRQRLEAKKRVCCYSQD
jgi:nitrogen fixation protein